MTNAETCVPLRIASYNLRCPCDPPPNDWPSRAPRVARTLAQCRFDIFGAQEATAIQIESIAKGNGYQWVGTGRECTLDGERSCIFYNPQRLDNVGSHTFWLSETPSLPGNRSWESACARICTFGIFRDRLNGRKFVFANTHLDHISRLAMSNGIRVILAHLDCYFGVLPICVTGDFNTFPGTEPVQLLSAKMRNARAASETPHAGPAGASYHAYLAEPHHREHQEPIDYIFVSEGIRVLRHEAVDDFADGLASSDHFPLFADVVF